MSDPTDVEQAKTVVELRLDLCDWCRWPLKERVEDGCVESNCSYRPVPPEPYDFKARRLIRSLLTSNDRLSRQVEGLMRERAALRERMRNENGECRACWQLPTDFVGSWHAGHIHSCWLLAALDAREAVGPGKLEPPALPPGHVFEPCPFVSGCLDCVQHPELCHERNCAQLRSAHKPDREGKEVA